MSIYRVIDKLEGYVQEGTWLPFGLRILSVERLSEYIEKMRATLPEEVGRAKTIASNKDRVIREAQERAQQIVTEAATTQAQLIDQSDIMRQARTTAEIVLREAEQKAGRMKAEAEAYAASLLGELEGRLSVALGSVKKGRDELATRAVRAQAAPAADANLVEAAAKNKQAAVAKTGRFEDELLAEVPN